MTIYVGSARQDENGKYSGGSAGDQTGKEVSTQTFYMHSKGWYILRPKSVTYANKIATAMLEACNNANIGYDQNQRTTLLTQYNKTKSIKAITTKCECDCSALVRVCVLQATGKDVGNFTTSNEVTVLVNSGLFEKKTCSSSADVYNGDILVTKTKGHTVIVTSGRARSTTSSVSYYNKYTGSSTKIDTVLKAIGVPSKYYGSYTKRKPIAKANGYSSYTGTSAQNLALIALAKKGKLIKP